LTKSIDLDLVVVKFANSSRKI